MIYEYSVVVSDHAMYPMMASDCNPAHPVNFYTCAALFNVALRMGPAGWRLVSAIALPRCETCTLRTLHSGCGGTMSIWERVVIERHDPLGDTSMRVRRDNTGDGSPAPSREAGA